MIENLPSKPRHLDEPAGSENEQKINVQRAFWVAVIFTTVAFSSFVLSIFLNFQFPAWQIVLMSVIAGLSLLFDILGVVMIRRGQAGTALKILYWSILLVLPLNVLLFVGVTPILVGIVLAMGYVEVFLLFPRPQRKYYQYGPLASAAVMGLIELLRPSFRYALSNLPTTGYWGQLVLAFLAIGVIILVIRQAITGNIFTKLIVAFIVVAVISVAAVALLAWRSLSSSLTANIGDHLSNLATAHSTEIGLSLEREYRALKVLATDKVIQNASLTADAATPLSQSEITRLDQQWQADDKAGNNNDPLIAGVLNNDTSTELKNFQRQFPSHVEVFLTGVQGVSIATTNRTSDYLQADEDWWTQAYQNGGYIGLPEFDPSSKTVAINMAVPVYENGTGRIIGILRTTVNFNVLVRTLTDGLFGKTGTSNIYLPNNKILRLNATGAAAYELVQEDAPASFQSLFQSTQKYLTISIQGVPTMASSATITMPGNAGEDADFIYFLKWKVVTLQTQSEALQPVNTQTLNIIYVTIAIILVVGLAAFIIARLITGPVIRLNEVAGRLAQGDLAAQAKVETQDEIGTLAGTFNAMTAQLRDLIGSLETRVAERTKDLATVAEVSTATATILKTSQLLQEVVDLTKERFHLYHSHIYLLDDSGENLVLAAGAGEPGRQMVAQGRFIPLNREQSLVARAARERKGVAVNDVTQAPDFLPNPLLPDTRSELAVPMIVAGNVIGVFDIQSDQVGRFTETDINIQTTLAAQLATTIQNVRSFESTREKAEMEALVNTIGQKIQLATSVEETLQVAVREIGLALGAKKVHAKLAAGTTGSGS